MDPATLPSAPPPSASPLEEDVVRVLAADGSVDPLHDPRIGDELAVTLYEAMVRARMLDRALIDLQRDGKVGFHSSSQGEEAAILGAAASVRPGDWLFPSPREFA